MDDRRKKYRAWDAQQSSQEPVSSRDALPEDDLVFFLLDLVPQMDFTPFHQYYAQELRGQPPFDVTMMVTLLVYAYSVGVCSSRRVAAACERNMAADSTSAPIPNTADTGHFSKEAVEGLEKLGMDPHLATGRQKHHEPRNWSELGFFNGHRWLVRPSPG